jgi:PKHD-type hydroxylase
MSFQIFNVLSQQEVEQLQALLANETFTDGSLTANSVSKDIKHNLQFGRATGLNLAQPTPHPASQLVEQAMVRNQALTTYTLAKAWVPPSFSRYDTGMHYADHVDSALMRAGPAILRTDLAMTLFLSPPENYDGGELILRSEFGEEEIKLEPGQAVVYTCRMIHRVEPVTRGSRLVCLTWIQSHVPDEGLRNVANDLQYLINLAKPDELQSEAHKRLTKAYHNLLRSATQGL